MRRTSVISTLMVASIASAAAVAEPTQFQVVPHGGLRLGGGFEDGESGDKRDLEEAASYGVGLELRVNNEDRWWQLWYSRQGTEVKSPDGAVDVAVEYLHFGGTAPISVEGRVHSYVVGGIGATRLSPAGAGLDDAVKFSASLGLGLRMPLSERVALRLEARGYLTVVDSDTSIFCKVEFGEGGCGFVTRGSSLFQAELSAGIAFGF
jgi:opacity protein-like surface antigen